MKRIIILVTLVSTMACWAKPSFHEILEKAKNGQSGWMILLAHAYQAGEGVEKNYAESERWYLKAIACSNNLGWGEAKLADLYRKGLGRPVDMKTAFKYSKIAADQGNVKGCCDLGDHYANGWGVEKDIGLAKKYYRQAADARGEWWGIPDAALKKLLKLDDGSSATNAPVLASGLPRTTENVERDLELCRICLKVLADAYANGGVANGELGRNRVKPDARLAALYGDMEKKISKIRGTENDRQKADLGQMTAKLSLDAADNTTAKTPAEDAYQAYLLTIYKKNNSTPVIGQDKSFCMNWLRSLAAAFEAGRDDKGIVFAPNPACAMSLRRMLAELKKESKALSVKGFREFRKEYYCSRNMEGRMIEEDYAAEAIPVLRNLRTQFGVYQFEKSCLPNNWKDKDSKLFVQTWKGSATAPEMYTPVIYALGGDDLKRPEMLPVGKESVWDQLGLCWEDIRGFCSMPSHYHYYVISATNNPSFVIACFGDGKGYKAGTGYAICEMNYPKKKYVGTWKRYQPVFAGAQADALVFTSALDKGCYVPSPATFQKDIKAQNDGEPAEIVRMRKAGWEF